MGLTIAAAGSALGITLDIASITNASLQFVGGSQPYFQFNNNSSGNSFQITGVEDGAGDSLGLYGSISGQFGISGVTQVGSYYLATVTGTGTLTIHDGLNHDFTAQVQWGDIYTLGATGGINYAGTINLSNISYSGTRSDLQSFLADQAASVNFPFSKPKTLLQLTASGANNSTSFSGVLHAVPSPSTVLLLGSGLVGILALCYRRRPRG